MENETKLYTIKEFSKLTNVSADTLRYYDRINLFKPSVRDEKTGYRYYTLSEFESIGVIQTLQLLGLSLNEIADFLSNKTFLSSYKLLKNQYETISGKISELQTLQRYLSEKLDLLDNIMSEKMTDRIDIKHFTRRSGYYTVKNCRNYRDVKTESARIIQKYTKNLFISNSYAIYIPQGSLESGSYKEHYYSMILDIEKEPDSGFPQVVFPEGDFAVTRFSGTAFESESTIKRLLEYIGSNGYKICGDAIQLFIVDENLTNLDDENINEIQIPIKAK